MHIRLLLITLLASLAFSRADSSSIEPAAYEVSDFLKLNATQKAALTQSHGKAVLRGILTAVGMTYCTIQDPHSFQIMTCAYDARYRGEFYSQRPGTVITLVGTPISGSNGSLALTDSRVYDANTILSEPTPTLQSISLESPAAPSAPSLPPPAPALKTATAPSAPTQTDSKEVVSSGETAGTSDESNPQFIRRAQPRRQAIGQSVSVYLGGTPLQNGDGTAEINASTATGFSGSNAADTHSNLGITIGAKYAYGWGLKNNEGEALPFIPSAEGEFLYTGTSLRSNVSGTGVSGTVRADLDVIAILGNGTLKFQAPPFYPYIGLGGGFAYIGAENARLAATSITSPTDLGDDGDVVLALQGLLGVEYVLSKQWSLFAEYKYLHLHNPSFHLNGAQVNMDYLAFHLFTLGVRTYF